MILLRTADRTGRQWLVPAGVHGYFPAEFPTGGDPSPLENDADLPADAGTQFLWWLRTPLLDATSNGTTTVTDAGAYTHTGADDGTWQQGYAWRALLADGSIESSVDLDAIIEFTLGSGSTISCGVGNAVAAGLDATITNNTGTTIACDVGNAVADGLTAFITQDITVSCTVGNAVAAGSTATITEGDTQQSLGGRRKRRRVPMVDPAQVYMAWARHTLAAVVSTGVLDG